MRPILRDAFSDVGLEAGSPPEKVALGKMIEEMLDRVTENGFFTFSDLRDTLSGNQLKLPDLADPNSFWRGDPLLCLDRRLATSMEGVYQRGEFYLRWLEAGSSLLFGTIAGRLLTRHVLMPFGGAFVLIFALIFFWNHYTHSDIQQSPWAFLPVGAFFLCLMHREALREWFKDAGRRIFRGLQWAFYEVPLRLWRLPWLRQALQSWPLLLLYWYVIKPLAVYGVLVWCYPRPFGSFTAAAITFLLANVVLNSTFGAAVGEAVMEALLILYDWLRFDALRGLVRLVSHFFKQVTGGVESLLYTVDEWVRFRSDVGGTSMAVRAVLGVLWFPVRYVFRLYFITLIEPTLNPLKLPLGILAAKFFVLLWPSYVFLMQPGSHEQMELITRPLEAHIGTAPAVLITYLFVVPTLWLLPSAVAFLIWELRGNWRLFRDNRSPTLRTAVVGHHGETVLQLLKPGAHSGTVPRLFAQLRHAERAAYHSGDWRLARTVRLALREVARSVQVFVEREFVALLHQSRSWPDHPVRVAQVILSCARIRVELAHAEYPKEAVYISMEQQYGYLLGAVQEAGWVAHLNVEQHRTLTTALAGLYKLAGVDFVREQLKAVLPPSHSGYQLTAHHLIVWTDRASGQGVAYDLRDRGEQLAPRTLNPAEPGPAPALDARQLLYSRLPITWERWNECWQRDQKGDGPSRVVQPGLSVLAGERSGLVRGLSCPGKARCGAA